MRSKILSVFGGLLFALSINPATAGLIDFEDVSVPSGFVYWDLPVFESGGFIFTANGAATNLIYTDPSACVFGCTANGSQSLALFGDPKSTTMTEASGAAFDLLGFDFAPFFATSLADLSNLLVLTGIKQDGSTVVAGFGFSDGGSFVTLPSTALAEFTDLISLTFSTDTFETALDNIQVSVAEVPAPATLALFGLGLAGLGLYRRKRV